MKLFEPFRLKNMELKNRIVLPPMCMYQATQDGFSTLFHICHYATRALGGAGLIIVESTGVTPEGRITDRDLGLWNDSQTDGLKRIVDACHKYGAKIALQINHAGRKSKSAAGPCLAPNALRFSGDGRADLVALGRELLRNPYWPVDTAVRNGVPGYVPESYKRAFPKIK